MNRLSRRTLLAAAPLAVAACKPGTPSRPRPPDAPLPPLADVHTHMFNARDLPLRGFAKQVLLPAMPNIPPALGRVLVDILHFKYRLFARSAVRELQILERQGSDFSKAAMAELDPDDAEVAAAVADAIIAGSQGQKIAPDVKDPTDQASPEDYAEFARALLGPDLAPAPKPGEKLKFNAPDPRQALIDQLLALDDEPATASAETKNNADKSLAVLDLLQLLRWAKLLGRSRLSHLQTYLAENRGLRSPRIIANMMVDYDYWLDEGPDRNSDMVSQIRVMAHIAVRASKFTPPVQLRNFAGWCPLRHAFERQRRQNTRLDVLKDAQASGLIAGIKLYPPMGFKPWNNASLDNQAFDSGRRRLSLLRSWEAVAGPDARIGNALDDALTELYEWCSAERLPILTHAGPGNQAGPGFGQRANPIYWEPVCERWPELRLILAHLVDNPQRFVNAVSSQTDDATVWALDAPRRLFDGLRPVLGDLGDLHELTDTPTLAREFFVSLRTIYDPELSHVTYGSDWLMIARNRGSRRFLPSIVEAMKATLSPKQIENILYNNAVRVLGQPVG